MKPSLILIPGFMCDARLFTTQIRAFESTHAVEVICVDAKARTIAEMARSILDQAPDRFAVLGLSMGGIVAMEIARQAADRLVHLALFDCNPMPDTNASSAERVRQIVLVKSGSLPEVMRNLHIKRYFTAGDFDAKIADLCLDMALARGGEAFVNHQHALMTRPDQLDALSQIRLPTLLACGAGDRLCSPHIHILMHQTIPGSRLEIIAQSGHLPTLDQPAATVRILRDWLRSAALLDESGEGFIL